MRSLRAPDSLERMPQTPETMPRHELERRLRRSRTWNVVLGAVAVIGLVFGGFQLVEDGNRADEAAAQGASGRGSAEANGGAGGTGDSAERSANIERRIDGDPMAIGELDAPIVLSEWVDFRCPFCAVFSRDTLPTLLKEYVDSGKVRIEMHDVAYFGEESARAAAAARAAGEQDRYAEFVAAVYKAAPEKGHPDLTPDELVAFAEVSGVPDIARFKTDMVRDDLESAVAESTAQAQQLGVSGVPFFVVNGQALSGAQPIDTFREVLDGALAEAKQ